jgi:hypothetical protein
VTVNYDDIIRALEDPRYADENEILWALINSCRRNKGLGTKYALLELITLLSRRNPDGNVLLGIRALGTLLERARGSIVGTLRRRERTLGAIAVCQGHGRGNYNAYWPTG